MSKQSAIIANTDEILLWHKRHAMQLASQLPEKQRDALLVIEALRGLTAGWLADDRVLTCEGNVVAFIAPLASGDETAAW